MYNVSTRINQQSNRINNNATFNYRTLNMFSAPQEDYNKFNNYNYSTRTQNKQLNNSFQLDYTLNNNIASNINYNQNIQPKISGVYVNRAIKHRDLSFNNKVDIDNTLKISKSNQNGLLKNNNDLDNCDFLSCEYTRLNDVSNSNGDNRCKEANINRFDGLNSDFENKIFFNFAKNTQLEARDEYKKKMKK